MSFRAAQSHVVQGSYLLLLLIFFLHPSIAKASVFELFGASPRSVGLVGALSAGASGGEATFHNPAMLSGASAAQVWVGFSATQFDLGIQTQRPVCTASVLSCSGQYVNGYAFRSPQIPSNSNGLQIGWAFPVGGVFRDRLSLGAGLALPNGHLIRIAGADPQSPNFAQYEGMPDRLAFLFAGSWRITDWWWVGLGTQVLAVLDARIDLNLDVVNHRMDKAAVQIGLAPRARVTAGTALHPMRQLWLGASYRQRLSLQYQIPTTVAFGQAASLGIDLGHDTLFTPDTAHLGVAWLLADDQLLLLADLGYAAWSQAPDPSPYVRLGTSGPLVDAFGLQSALQVGQDTPQIALHYNDTWTPSLAGEWRLQDWRLRLGGQYRPTPAPRALGAFNYLDNNAFVLGAGIGFRFGTLSEEAGQHVGRMDDPAGPPGRFHVDLGVQSLMLQRRTDIKRDVNDPEGNLSYGGTVWHVSLAVGSSF